MFGSSLRRPFFGRGYVYLSGKEAIIKIVTLYTLSPLPFCIAEGFFIIV